MISVFLKNIVYSLAATVLVTIYMVVSSVEERFLIDYATISFFVVFSALYFINVEPRCNSSLSANLVRVAEQIIAWSIISLALFGIVVLAMWISSAHPYFPEEYQWKNTSAIVIILTSALFEETLMRGYVFSFIWRYTTFIKSSLAASFIFALFHAPFEYGFLQFLSHFVFGLLTCTLTAQLKSLIPGIVVHTIFNYCVGSSHLAFELAKTHLGLVHFQSETRTEDFLFFKTIVLLITTFVILRLNKSIFQPAPSHSTATKVSSRD